MRVLFTIADSGPDAVRMMAVARDLHERGHDAAVVLEPGTGWRSVFRLARRLADLDAEIAVGEGARSHGLLRWARRFHPATRVTALAASDIETAEPELEAARALGRGYGRAVFLDRDGTLMPEVGPLGRPEAVRLLPGVAPALRALAAARYELVVISNQSAIGRGAVREADVRAVHAALRRVLRADGVELAGIFFCPHRPEDACDCRKPAPGLLLQAATALRLRLADSWMIGDSTRDTEAAARAGVKGILLETGWGGGDPAAPAGAAGPAIRTRDIASAAGVILRR